MSTIKEIKRSLSTRDTEELLNIWKQNDRTEWVNEAFAAIREILIERGEALPPQNNQPAVETDADDRIERAGSEEDKIDQEGSKADDSLLAKLTLGFWAIIVAMTFGIVYGFYILSVAGSDSVKVMAGIMIVVLGFAIKELLRGFSGK